MAKEIKTFVFFDTETTGLPHQEFNKTKITELAFIACSKVELLKHAGKGDMPRVKHKLAICLNPMKSISSFASEITGLNDQNLKHEKSFSSNTGELLKMFLNQLQAPICLVAHNGFRFDFPILRKELDTAGVDCGSDIYCADSLEIFRSIAKESSTPKERMSFKLDDIYKRLYGTAPVNAHNAEEDTKILFNCCLFDAKRFIECAEKSMLELAAIKPMGGDAQ